MPPIDVPGGTLCAALLLGVTVYYVLNPKSPRSKVPLPPGPKPLPLVGNVFDVPKEFPWKKYTEWSKEFDSDIIHLDLAGTPLIVLCSSEAADDLLEKRAAIYSDRPNFPMVVDLMGWDFNFALLKYGDEWRTHRRLFNQEFNAKSARKYEPQQLDAVRELLQRLSCDPVGFEAHFSHFTGELIMSVAYGIDVLPHNDPYVNLSHEAVGTLSLANLPGKYLVDTFPLLKHIPKSFPGAGFKRQAEEWRVLAHAMAERPLVETKHQMEAGVARPSFASESLNILRETDNAYFQEKHIRSAAGTMFIGGSDTTVSALLTFLLAMIANPDAQRKAQAEIDSVTGGTSLPNFDQKDSMPYVSALIKEVMRWEVVTPVAIPHLLTMEDEYRGYRLPAGSIVVGNAWAILHDEKVYPEPHAFKPERFLLDGKLDPAMKDPISAFGFGRRLCPGRHMASSSIWLAITSMLATLTVAKVVDDEGHVIEPSYEYLSGFISAPLPFKCSITPRSPGAAGLILGRESKS
ncbi:cytochrome P450 [Mycena crocata]|nr:cytochrome P450 [Mycena crocata]